MAADKIETILRAVSGETGLTYQLWANGDGIRITQGARPLHDAGSHVRCIPLADVELVARLIHQHRAESAE